MVPPIAGGTCKDRREIGQAPFWKKYHPAFICPEVTRKHHLDQVITSLTDALHMDIQYRIPSPAESSCTNFPSRGTSPSVDVGIRTSVALIAFAALALSAAAHAEDIVGINPAGIMCRNEKVLRILSRPTARSRGRL
jgi:hypothetical protein